MGIGVRCAVSGSAWLALAVLSACANVPRPGPEIAAAGSTTAPPAPAPDPSTLASGGPHIPKVAEPAARASWVEAMRMFDWETAALRLDELSENERDAAPARFARARAAAELRDFPRVIAVLDGLDAALPLLRAEVETLRRTAELEVGPFEAPAQALAQSSDPEELTLAAELYQKAGRTLLATTTIRRAWQRYRAQPGAARTNAKEARLRRKRAEISLAAKRKSEAAADLLWLATTTPTLPEAEDAAARLEALLGRPTLTKHERYTRAEAFAKSGLAEQVEGELALMKSAPGAGPSLVDTVRTRAWAHFRSRGDYALAASLFEESARLDPSNRPSDLFHAARALSRANQDRVAIGKFDELAKAYPGTYFGEHAQFMGGRVSFVLGDYADAERRFAAYLERYGKSKRRKRTGRFESDVHYERAVARLAAGDFAVAATLLEPLFRRSDERERNRLRELYATALAGAGKKSDAVREFRAVISDEPLSFVALASSARLRQLGEPEPALIAPSTTEPVFPPLGVTLPAKAALLVQIGLDVEAEAALAAEERNIRQRFEPRGGEALCALYGQLTTAYRRYRIGQQIVRERVLTSAPSPRDAWTWDCVYPRPYSGLVAALSTEFRLPGGVVHAVMRQESAFRPDAVSSADAVGLMQLIPSTATRAAAAVGWAHVAEKLTSPAYNLKLGSYYFGRVLDRFGSRVELAAAAYNAGPHAVTRWLEAGEKLDVDVWTAAIPYPETREYVYRVVGNWARYRYLEGGPAALARLELAVPDGLRATSEDY